MAQCTAGHGLIFLIGVGSAKDAFVLSVNPAPLKRICVQVESASAVCVNTSNTQLVITMYMYSCTTFIDESNARCKI